MKPTSLKPSVTLVDGTTFQYEFPFVPSSTDKYENSGLKKKPSLLDNVYYESLKPIFIVMTLSGVLPVFRLRMLAGKHKMQVTLIGGICVGVYALFGYLTVLCAQDILRLITNDNDFNSIVVQVTLVMLLLQHVFYPLLTWPESFSVNRYLLEWGTFQKQYEQVTGTKLFLTCRRKVTLTVLVMFVLSVFYPQTVKLVDANSIINNKTHVVLSYHFFLQQCFYILWFSNSWAVTQAAQQFNQHLSQACDSDITAEKLEDYRLVWLRLSQMVRSGSSMLSYTMALVVITPFAYQVIAAYNLTMDLMRTIMLNKPFIVEQQVTTACTLLFYMALLYMFCNAGHCITRECEQVQGVLLTHKPKVLALEEKVNTGLRLFLRCMRSVPPLASLSGYVSVDRKGFLHMMGILVTYLIILVQFNINSIIPTKANEA